MKSDLIRQVLQRYTDTGILRNYLVRQPAIAVSISGTTIPAETDNTYEDRVDKYKAKVYRLRTYILDNCDSQIADYYAEAYNTASELQDYLLDQFGKARMS